MPPRIFSLCLLLVAASAAAEPPPLRTVPAVDIDRYSGLWREAARLPNRFENGCVFATARYAMRPDGLLGIRNQCRKGDGRTTAIEGRARIVEGFGAARLKVSFFGPLFVGDYWVIDLAPDYSWAIVGEPRRRYLWILTREPASPALRADLEARVNAHGYNAAQLYWNPG